MHECTVWARGVALVYLYACIAVCMHAQLCPCECVDVRLLVPVCVYVCLCVRVRMWVREHRRDGLHGCVRACAYA